MRKKIKSLLLAGILILSGSFAWAQSTPLEEILTHPDEFDSKMVEVEGEAVGEVLFTDKGAWINIKDSSYNIGVFSEKKGAFEGIKYWGCYGQEGDWVKIKGIFNKDCLLHQVSDLHLQSFEVKKRGHIKKRKVSSEKRKAATKLFIICLTTAVIYFIKLKYGKRATTDRSGV